MKNFHALSNIEIDNYFNDNRYYGGTYSKDKLPKFIENNKFYIVNLDDAMNGGTHWCLICNFNNNNILYIDPFGVVPPIQALDFMRTSKRHIYYSTLTLQDIKSILCGYYCIYMIEQMIDGRLFLDIIAQDFTNDRIKNDNLIKRYFKNVQF